MHLVSRVEINVYSYYYIICLPCQCCSESVPNAISTHQFKKFSGPVGAYPQTPIALYAVHNNIIVIWNPCKLKLVIIIST